MPNVKRTKKRVGTGFVIRTVKPSGKGEAVATRPFDPENVAKDILGLFFRTFGVEAVMRGFFLALDAAIPLTAYDRVLLRDVRNGVRQALLMSTGKLPDTERKGV